MATCARVFARTLAEAGVTRLFGLPGGEVLDFLEAARAEGIDFVLTHHEAAASFMADAAGQLQRVPGVAVGTLGPGAINLLLGVANAYLDRSPVLVVTAALPMSVAPYTTHQNVDLGRLYAPCTKATISLDGTDTAAKVLGACRTAMMPRPGPVHITLASDVARQEDRDTGLPRPDLVLPPPPAPAPADVARLKTALSAARRPLLILGLDLAPYDEAALVRRFAEHLNVPVFVAPKAKGVLPEDHPLFFGVCAGVAADHVILDFFARADLLVGIGYDPVESNRIWHKTMKLASIGPATIAAGAFTPYAEVVGDLRLTLPALMVGPAPPFQWSPEELASFRDALEGTLRGRACPGRVSPYALTRQLRELFPRETIATTDVGAVKFIVSQAWTTYTTGGLLQSNGLSSMGFGVPAAVAARLHFPDRPVLCTVGDGGFMMSLGEIETAVRRGLDFVTVVYDDRQLSLIQVIQENKRLPRHGVDYGAVDFAALARACGAWGRQVTSLEEVGQAVEQARAAAGPAVLDVLVDPDEYRAHTRPWEG